MASGSSPPSAGRSAARFWRAGTAPSLSSTAPRRMKASGRRRGSLIDCRHPIPRSEAGLQFRPATDGHVDIVPASFILVVRIVSEDVLAVNLMTDLGDRVLEPLLLEETELLPARRLRHLLGRVVDEDGF